MNDLNDSVSKICYDSTFKCELLVSQVHQLGTNCWGEGGWNVGWWDLWEKQGCSLTDCVPKEVLPRELFADMAVRSFCASDIIQAAV